MACWARQHEAGVSCKGNACDFYRELPANYVVRLFISAELDRRVEGFEGVELERKLEAALEDGDGDKAVNDPNYDFDSAIERVRQVLAQYDEDIPKHPRPV